MLTEYDVSKVHAPCERNVECYLIESGTVGCSATSWLLTEQVARVTIRSAF